jgi:hypothetical protein
MADKIQYPDMRVRIDYAGYRLIDEKIEDVDGLKSISKKLKEKLG